MRRALARRTAPAARGIFGGIAPRHGAIFGQYSAFVNDHGKYKAPFCHGWKTFPVRVITSQRVRASAGLSVKRQRLFKFSVDRRAASCIQNAFFAAPFCGAPAAFTQGGCRRLVIYAARERRPHGVVRINTYSIRLIKKPLAVNNPS